MSSSFVAVKLGVLRALVKNLLLHPPLEGWSVQGLGMLRFYMEGIARLHIWDPRIEFADVSKIHNHSWNFRSIVIAGAITNLRFVETSDEGLLAMYNKQRLRCGMGGGRKGEVEVIGLRALPPETWLAGETYGQGAAEIHYTDAAPGTVTIVEREDDGPEGEADIYWPYGQRWVSAEPRPATRQEVLTICSYSLERYFQ